MQACGLSRTRVADGMEQQRMRAQRNNAGGSSKRAGTVGLRIYRRRLAVAGPQPASPPHRPQRASRPVSDLAREKL